LPKTSTEIYADSVFYVQNSNDYFINPVITGQGTFTSFPDGLNIDNNTGLINVNKSETGLKYKITFTPAGSGSVLTSYIVISGINYSDKIYNLSLGDSIAVPVYNADHNLALPGTNNGNSFDQSGGCKNAGIVVGSTNGTINLAQTIKNQVIDTGSTAQVKLVYSIADNSNKAPNGLEVKIYFYRTVSQIPQYLTDLINQRKTTILTSGMPPLVNAPATRLTLNSLAVHSSTIVRSRPPCIVVVSR